MLLAEGGRRGQVIGSANWLWSAEIALFVLFVFSVLAWVRHYAPLIRARIYPRAFGWTALALGLHFVSGLVWLSMYAAGGWGYYWLYLRKI